MVCDQRTRDYITRKQQEGKGTKEILRCLKRAIAREIFRLITNPVPAIDHSNLRPLRKERGILQLDAARALGVNPAKISLAENGKVHDAVFLTNCATWLQNTDLTP